MKMENVYNISPSSFQIDIPFSITAQLPLFFFSLLLFVHERKTHQSSFYWEFSLLFSSFLEIITLEVTFHKYSREKDELVSFFFLLICHFMLCCHRSNISKFLCIIIII